VQGNNTRMCESHDQLEKGGAVKCYYKETFDESATGEYAVRCFTAKDPHGDRVYLSQWRSVHPLPTEHPPVEDGKCSAERNAGGLELARDCVVTENSIGGKTLKVILNDRAPGAESAWKAYDLLTASAKRLTCRSLPMCLKIKISSRPPRFVEPTPLDENSYADNGRLVKGRTDVAVCEGYPLDLTLAAEDPDSQDLVRIFVEDRDDDSRVETLLDFALQGQDVRQENKSENTYNLDFFATNKTMNLKFPAECAGANDQTTFDLYAARRIGDNSKQNNILVLDDSQPKSVVSRYATHIEYRKKPMLSIDYTLNISKRNGIVARKSSKAQAMSGDIDAENCYDSRPSQSPALARCREKILNMDQVICALAYDNSRSRYRKWVGKTNPNSPSLSWSVRDHSNGDTASPLHCWRLKLQSRPTFVTNWQMTDTPFSPDYWIEGWAGDTTSGDPSTSSGGGDEREQRALLASINEQLSFSFVAQDPNPGDNVEILIPDDPGLPAGMKSSGTICLPRFGSAGTSAGGVGQGGAGMCKADDLGAIFLGEPTPLRQVSSSCSKAQLLLTWIPFPDQANLEYKVCARARDSSTACHGKGPPASEASSRGWFGEQQCVIIRVLGPAIEWVPDIAPNELEAFVGCTVRFVVRAQDCSRSRAPSTWMATGSSPHTERCLGNYDVNIESVGALPEGAVFYPISRPTGGLSERAVEWNPKRGTEGSVVTACFTARDAHLTQKPIDEQCWSMTVQKCQYCLGSTDTLSILMKEYALDTNWLRVWLHNGNYGPSETSARVNNPDLIVTSHNISSLQGQMSNYRGQPIVWAGVMYEAGLEESLSAIAVRFRYVSVS
jgi:hypothetical protein